VVVVVVVGVVWFRSSLFIRFQQQAT